MDDKFNQNENIDEHVVIDANHPGYGFTKEKLLKNNYANCSLCRRC